MPSDSCVVQRESNPSEKVSSSKFQVALREMIVCFPTRFDLNICT